MMNQYVHARRWAVTLLMGLVCLFAFAQGQNVTGTVTDPAGEPLIGVSVQVKGAKTGAITDFDGNFKLANVPAGSVLVFSYIGYLSQEIPVEKGKNAPLNVVLREDAQNLEEVVVIGYGSVKKKDITGSVATVDAEALVGVPVASAVEAMQGKLAGVQITTTEGSPDAEMKIRVRGGGSITQSNDPLFIVDGFPVESISDIPATDIEDITVLKDASSTAIYGSRGANGVIIVTTKDGRKDEKPVVEVVYSIAVANPVKEFKPLTTEEFLRYTDQNLRNAAIAYNNFEGYSAMFTPYMPSMALFSFDEYGQVVYEGLDMTRFNPDVQTDWVREVKNRNALTHQYNASVRGGSQRTNYSLSLNGSNEEGLYRNDSMETYGGRIALNTDLSDRVKLGGVMNYSETKRRSTSDGLGTASAEAKPWLVRPDIAVYDELGELNRIDTGLSAYGMDGVELTPSPVGLLERQTRHASNQFLGNLFAEIELFRGLKFRTDFSMTHYTFQSS